MTMCLDVDDFYCPQKQKQHSITYVVFKGFTSLMRLWCDSSNKIRRLQEEIVLDALFKRNHGKLYTP